MREEKKGQREEGKGKNEREGEGRKEEKGRSGADACKSRAHCACHRPTVHNLLTRVST